MQAVDTMTVFFDKSFTNMPERTYNSPEHFDKNLSRDIVDIFFSLNQFAHQQLKNGEISCWCANKNKNK